jgi:signal transduction histidine kinase
MTTPAQSDPRTERLLALLQKALGHELPNQLLAIQGLARVLDMEEGERLGAESKEFLMRLAAAAQRTHELVRMLAEFIRATRAVPLDRPTLLATVVTQAVRDVGGRVSTAAAIECALPDGDIYLSIPSTALHRVLVELLRFAAGTIPADRKACLRVGALVTGEGVDLWVADNSAGLSEEQRARLLEPFAGRPVGAAGTGLELILAQHLVECWGGSLHIQSLPQQGNTFTAKLAMWRGPAIEACA